jgi:hypothetical protein
MNPAIHVQAFIMEQRKNLFYGMNIEFGTSAESGNLKALKVVGRYYGHKTWPSACKKNIIYHVALRGYNN